MAPPVDLSTLLNPRTYVIRVYVLTGMFWALVAYCSVFTQRDPALPIAQNLVPHDSNGENNPYVCVRLGGRVLSARARSKERTLDPEFYEVFELQTTLPGPSQLSIEVWDKCSESVREINMFGDRIDNPICAVLLDELIGV